MVDAVGESTDLSSLPFLFSTSWRNRTAGTASNKLWYASLSLVTLIMYSIATGGLILMAVFYTQKDGCVENKILLGINGGLCLLISAVAISPCVQNRKHSFFPFFLIHIINVFEQHPSLFGNYGHSLIYHRWVSNRKGGTPVSPSCPTLGRM